MLMRIRSMGFDHCDGHMVEPLKPRLLPLLLYQEAIPRPYIWTAPGDPVPICRLVARLSVVLKHTDFREKAVIRQPAKISALPDIDLPCISDLVAKPAQGRIPSLDQLDNNRITYMPKSQFPLFHLSPSLRSN